MSRDSQSEKAVMGDWTVRLSGALLLAAGAWNVVAGEWMDGLFVLGLGIGGALLIGARAQSVDTSASALRWTGIALLVGILLLQLGMLLRYLLLG